MKTFFALISFLVFFTCGVHSQPADTSGGRAAGEAAHYDYLREELNAYRAFLEKERKEHRAFLEEAYRRSMIIISVFLAVLAALGGVLTFLGVRTLRNIRESARLAYQNQIKSLLDTELVATERKIEALKRLIRHEEMWANARLRFVGEEAHLNSFRRNELGYFGGLKANFDVHPLRDRESFAGYDAVVHYFAPDENQEDPMLQNLLERLQGQTIPLIVYTHGLWIDRHAQTKRELDAYQFQTMANNIITLLNNTSDAFRLKLTA